MEKMLGVGEVKGPIADLFEKLGGSNGGEWLRDLKKFLRKENPFSDNDSEDNFVSIKTEWEEFYQKFFRIEYGFSQIIIPKRPVKGRWRLLIITDILLEHLYAKCRENFPCWRWTDDDLDKIVVENERDAKNGAYAYAIWVKDVVEADENLKNLSANNIKEREITTETLAERLIHELKFFDETGNHLDIQNWTLCSGSRDGDGSVPSVHWDDDEMLVNWYHSDHAHGCLRSRQAVS